MPKEAKGRRPLWKRVLCYLGIALGILLLILLIAIAIFWFMGPWIGIGPYPL